MAEVLGSLSDGGHFALDLMESRLQSFPVLKGLLYLALPPLQMFVFLHQFLGTRLGQFRFRNTTITLCVLSSSSLGLCSEKDFTLSCAKNVHGLSVCED